MSERRPLVAGNWKMFKSVAGGVQLTEKVGAELESAGSLLDRIEVAVIPPFTALYAISRLIEYDKLPIGLGAQDCYWEAEGAFTGEVSVPQLADVGCTMVIIGHSERRQYFGETDETVNKKVHAALKYGLMPIVCVGESLATREAGDAESYVREQVMGGLAGLTPEQASGMVIAYEPIWAIGTGRTAVPEDANDMCRMIRATVGAMYGPPAAVSLRVLYGGSVKPENAGMFLGEPDIDGALVGGASLDPDPFVGICKAAGG